MNKEFRQQLEEQYLIILKQTNSNEQDTEKLAVLSNYLIELNKLDYQKVLWERDKELEKEISTQNAEFSQRKFDQFMGQWRQAGGLDAVFKSITRYFNSKAKENEIEKEVNLGLKENPIQFTLKTIVNSIDDNQLEKIKCISYKIYYSILDLKGSSSVQEMTMILKSLESDLLQKDPQILIDVYNIFDENQQKVINSVIKGIFTK